MSEYTPTTENVRSVFAHGGAGQSTDRRRAMFDRWLAAHDAEVRAGVVAEEPEWQYGWRSRFATGGPVFQELEWESREQAEQSIRDHEIWEAEDPAESRLVYELVKRTPAVRAGEWVPVKQEGADDV